MPPFPISRILVLGASGQFGGRLCRRLVQLGGLHLLLGGRDEQRLKVAQRQVQAVNARPVAAINRGQGLSLWIAAHRYKWFGKRATCFVPRRGREPDQLPLSDR